MCALVYCRYVSGIRNCIRDFGVFLFHLGLSVLDS